MSRRTLLLWADHDTPYGVGRHTNELADGLCGRWDVRRATGHDLWGATAPLAWTDHEGAAAVYRAQAPAVALFANAGTCSNVAAIEVAAEMQIPRAVLVHLLGAPLSPSAQAAPALLERAVAQLIAADRVITPSHAGAGMLTELGRTNVDVVPNGVSDEFFTERPGARDALRAVLGLPDDAVVCLTAARMDPEKGWDILVAAVIDLADRDPFGRLHFLWVGDGSMRARLTALVRMHRLDRVHVLGPRHDIATLIAASDLMVLPTRRDAAPLAIIEAMAGGLPIVATDVGDIAWIVGDGGIVLEPEPEPPSVVHALSDALDRLERDREQRRELGGRARARADALFRSSAMVDRYDELLSSLIG